MTTVQLNTSRFKLVTYLIMGAICFLIFIEPALYVRSAEWVTVTVTDKMGLPKESGMQYRIYTDSEVFCNEDSFLFRKWNSSDFYGQIEKGATYRMRVAGWRVPRLSWYRNIVEFVPVTPNQKD